MSLAAVVSIGSCCAYAVVSSLPPSDKALMAAFKANKPVYEQLRGMLQHEDPLITMVADWGVMRGESTIRPEDLRLPGASFPAERYDEYMRLLKKIGGLSVSRFRAPDPQIRILVWASGFAGDTIHEAICWQPDEQELARLHDYYKPIEESWFVYRDFKPH
ncbi:MAG TPA: hypothetical protein VH083_20270 [Myxococcales bacterium]|nr:hypothetical protein [Myxococcales bacterium]